MTGKAPSPSAQILARRDYAGPAFLAQGFRPFFLGAGIWAVLALATWLTEWLGLLPPVMFLDVHWHAHEMIFGFGAAAMAGFLLTAIPNWTGRLPVRGAPLALLALLWLAGRLAMLGRGAIGPGLAGAIDSAFLIVLALAVWREIIAGKNWRNLKTAAAVSILAAANIAWHAVAAHPGLDTLLPERLAIITLVSLLALIGGRITPSFTRNVLARRGTGRLPAPFSGLDRAALVMTVLAGASWTVAPGARITGALAVIACVLNLVRLGRWRTLDVLEEPMLWVLHLGYAWIGAGFALIAAHGLAGLVPQSAAIHAFTAGGFGTMMLGVMTRAARGHSGLKLQAGAIEPLIYAAVSLSAVLRIAAAASNRVVFYQASGLLWVLAFGLFVIAYWTILTTNMRLRQHRP